MIQFAELIFVHNPLYSLHKIDLKYPNKGYK